MSGKNQNYCIGQQPMYQKSSVMWVGSSWLRVLEYHVRMANSVPQAGFLSQLGWVNLVCYGTLKKHHASKQPTDQPTNQRTNQEPPTTSFLIPLSLRQSIHSTVSTLPTLVDLPSFTKGRVVSVEPMAFPKTGAVEMDGS